MQGWLRMRVVVIIKQKLSSSQNGIGSKHEQSTFGKEERSRTLRTEQRDNRAFERIKKYME